MEKTRYYLVLYVELSLFDVWLINVLDKCVKDRGRPLPVLNSVLSLLLKISVYLWAQVMCEPHFCDVKWRMNQYSSNGITQVKVIVPVGSNHNSCTDTSVLALMRQSVML
jgi:hypothetical protein